MCCRRHFHAIKASVVLTDLWQEYTQYLVLSLQKYFFLINFQNYRKGIVDIQEI